MPRPRGGEWLEDEIRGYAQFGVTTLVSLLEETEKKELSLGEEELFAQLQGIDFVSFPIPDRGVPASNSDFLKLTYNLTARIEQGQGIAIHCRAGIGRSGLLASAILVSSGTPSEEVFAVVSRARSFPVPDTQEQINWFHQFCPTLNTLD